MYNVGMLWADDNIQLLKNYLSSLIRFKSLEKRFARDITLKENFEKTVDEDIQKGYVITVPDAHMAEQRSETEWYLRHHPVINSNRPGKNVGY